MVTFKSSIKDLRTRANTEDALFSPWNSQNLYLQWAVYDESGENVIKTGNLDGVTTKDATVLDLDFSVELKRHTNYKLFVFVQKKLGDKLCYKFDSNSSTISYNMEHIVPSITTGDTWDANMIFNTKDWVSSGESDNDRTNLNSWFGDLAKEGDAFYYYGDFATNNTGGGISVPITLTRPFIAVSLITPETATEDMTHSVSMALDASYSAKGMNTNSTYFLPACWNFKDDTVGYSGFGVNKIFNTSWNSKHNIIISKDDKNYQYLANFWMFAPKAAITGEFTPNLRAYIGKGANFDEIGNDLTVPLDKSNFKQGNHIYISPKDGGTFTTQFVGVNVTIDNSFTSTVNTQN